MLLCVGPEGSGKTLLLKQIVSDDKIIDAKTIPTVGVNIYKIQEPEKKAIYIRELGGSMAPIWHSYYRGIQKVIYVIDASNLIQLGSATLCFLSLISNHFLSRAQIAIVFNKIDCPLPRSTKELLGVMRFEDIKEMVRQELVVFEVSALTNKGLKPLIRWIKGEDKK